MKKLIIFVLVFILTGCGNSCERNFKSNMTKNYSKHAKNCEVVKYTNEKSNVEIVTTPSKDKKSFNAEIKANGYDVNYSYFDTKFVNAKINQYNGINFLELYDTNKKNNVYLIVFDDVGNIRYEVSSTAKPIIKGDNFTVKEYRWFIDEDYECVNYSDLDRIAYTEKTYNMMDMSVVKSKNILLKDVCK